MNDHTLVAPNEAVAEQWRKDYPGWTVLVRAKIEYPPSKKLLAIKAKLTKKEGKELESKEGE